MILIALSNPKHLTFMKQLYYICAQPAIVYYEWHLEVMIHNFRKNGIRDDQIHIVLGKTDTNSQSVYDKLRLKYPTIVFGLYDDSRESRVYISSLRPNILKQHFKKYPELSNHAIFYHDCDIAFTKPVSWDHLLNDEVWYLSDTQSYIGARYIKSKGLNILQEMCDIVGISSDKVDSEEHNSGGAQYILKNITPEFWGKVEHDSEELTKYFITKAMEYKTIPDYHPIQSWTADMWAVLWNGWYFGHEIKVVPEMNFCWPTNQVMEWGRNAIYHNAGVVSSSTGMFYKAQYTQSAPFDIQLDSFDTKYCSYRYAQEILDTANTSCLL
jgi:hypothetical protein